jgi:hypothetical protein
VCGANRPLAADLKTEKKESTTFSFQKMARSAAVLVLALAALTSSAAGQALNGAQLTQAAARFAKNKGGSGTRCSVGTPSISYAIDGRPGTTDHPMTPGIASQFIANQVSVKSVFGKLGCVLKPAVAFFVWPSPSPRPPPMLAHPSFALPLLCSTTNRPSPSC